MHKLYSGDIVFWFKKGREGQIISINDNGIYEVLMNNQEFDYDNAHSVHYDELVLMKREYKILNLTESPDSVTREMKLLAKLAPMEKLFTFLGDKSFRIHSMFKPNNVELFILPLNSILSEDFLNNPEETKLISLTDFETVTANMDGRIEYIRRLR